MNSLPTLNSFINHAGTHFECLSDSHTSLGPATFLPLNLSRAQASPSPTPPSKLSEYLQHVNLINSFLDPVTPSTDTDIDSIFDDEETVTDSSPLDTPTCETVVLTDYFGDDNESLRPHLQVSQFANHANKMNTKTAPEVILAITEMDQQTAGPHLLPAQPLSPKMATNVDVISTDMNATANFKDADGDLLQPPAHPASLPRKQRGKCIAPEEEGIPEGVSVSQIYSEMGGFMFQHLDTTPGLRQLFATRDHRKGSKHIKEEVRIMYDNITRHRALGYDDESIADLVVREVYAWRGMAN
ncbi:hypothetical protein V1509DRAFT_568897 [Lipomyces kononenkoae]